MANGTTNVVIAGLGGQGVLKASDILADTAFRAGYDTKKAEVHGMSQRGGSVSSDVRYGKKVLSPMVSAGEADYVLVLEETQIEVSANRVKEGGILLNAGKIDKSELATPKALNVAALGMLSKHLDIPTNIWIEAIKAALPEKVHEANMAAFELGRSMS